MQDTREFITTQLNTPLTVGIKYYVSFKVNLSLFSPTYFNTASNKLGMFFSTVSHDAANWAAITNFAHVYSNSIISDTANWASINGSFIADSSYNYIIIGNFFDDANTDTLIYSQDTGCGQSSCQTAYYFIDDVCVSTDSLLCSSPTSVGKLLLDNELLVYPNPTSEALFISILGKNLGNKKSSIQLIDGLGYTRYSKRHLSEKEKIDLTSLPFGIYYIIVQIDNNIYRKKIIKN